MKAFHGLQVTKATPLDDGYELQVATRPIRHRGDTLGGPVLTVKVHSPTEGMTHALSPSLSISLNQTTRRHWGQD